MYKIFWRAPDLQHQLCTLVRTRITQHAPRVVGSMAPLPFEKLEKHEFFKQPRAVAKKWWDQDRGVQREIATGIIIGLGAGSCEVL